jgi:hypothetical protein
MKGLGILRSFVLYLVIVVLALSCVRIIALERRKAELKRDRIELHHVKYGLFNVDEWKIILADIISKKINELEVTQENRPQMKAKVEEILHRVVNELEKVMKEQNARSLSGLLQQVLMDLFGSMDTVRKGIPRYADQVIDYLNDPANREELKGYLIKRLNEMIDETVGKTDYRLYSAILHDYKAWDRLSCIAIIDQELTQVRARAYLYIGVLIACCAGLAALILLGRNYGATELIAMVLGAVVLLIAGLSLPMIDIEASISMFSFKLLGHEVAFKDQVLFYQSKSILQVVWILLQNGGVGLVLVAILVFAFSVLVPVAKLIASTITIIRNERPTHWLHRFLVFKSGKWSMADVMVVAIFMSFIGFNGVINSQLVQLTKQGGNVELFTTNNSVLQTGFYLFTAYCLVGLLLSAMIEKRLESVGR